MAWGYPEGIGAMPLQVQRSNRCGRLLQIAQNDGAVVRMGLGATRIRVHEDFLALPPQWRVKLAFSLFSVPAPPQLRLRRGFFILRTCPLKVFPKRCGHLLLHRPRLPNLSAPHFHRRQLPTKRSTRAEPDQMAEVENLVLGHVANDGDLARHLVVL